MEIERKFLVRSDDYKRCAHKSYRIKQGYISSGNGRTVRVRIRDNQGFLTIKGPSLDDGLSHYEPGIIDKTRYLVASGKHTFEVDEFYGDNDGLVIAEVELSSADEPYEKPDFVGEEVTYDRRYRNAQLRINPYKNW